MSSSYFMLRFLKQKRQQKSILNDSQGKIQETKTNHLSNKCRICLKDGNIPIFDQYDSFDLSAAIHMYGDVVVTEFDEYPKHICYSCHKFLQKALLFKRTAQNTDIILRNTHEEKSDLDLGDNDGEISKPFNCKLTLDCLKTYTANKTTKHKNIRIQCTICHRLLTAQLYKRHLERHQSTSHLICDVCGKLYRKDNLVRHLQLHSYELPFHCQVCPYRGRFMESLKIHMRTHTGNKPFSCSECELKFLTRSNLNRHLLTHKKDRPFKCAECGRGFYTKRDMDIHFKVDHVGVKDFGCRLCGNKYATRKALMRHELRVHKRVKMAKGRMPLYLQAEYQKS